MATIVTANSRLARILRELYDKEQAARGLTVWITPEILPVGAWLKGCWQTWLYSEKSAGAIQLLSMDQELAIWDDIIARSEAANELLHVAPTAKAAMDAFQLMHDWDVPLDAPEWDNSKDSEVFRQWARRFIAVCERQNWLSVARLSDFVAAKVSAGEIPVPAEVRFAGFLEFTRAEDRLLQALKLGGAKIEIQKLSGLPPSGAAVRIGFPDAAQEIRTAAGWSRRQLELHHQPDGPGPSIGIVVPDLSLHRASIERLFAEELHPNCRISPEQDAERAFNISLGLSLSDYPLIQAALLILRINPGTAIAFDDFTRMLRCPFIDGASEETHARAVCDVELRKWREPEMPLAQILGLVPSGLKAALMRWEREFSKHPTMQLPSDWAAHFSRLLSAIGWPGDRTLRSTEFQTATAWNEIIAELASLDSVAGTISRTSALLRLQRMTLERQFQPESYPAPIQILGAFEASGLTFDHLWILGMHDGAWPRAANPNPFLPLQLQRVRNVPHSSPQRELSFTRLLTDQLLASSPDVVVSFPRKESDSDLRPSPMISEIREVSAVELMDGLELSDSSDHAEILFRSSELENVIDSFGPPWTGVKLQGGTSMFTYQSACAFQSFAKLRLGADILDSPSAGLNAAERGMLVHDVLRRVWDEFGTHQTLVDSSPEFVSAVILDEVRAAISNMAKKKAALCDARYAAIEQFRLERLVREWLELEKERKPFIVLPLEQQREVQFGGIGIHLKADRIDKLEDGSHIILDYKTSVHSPKAWEGPRPDEPQLPLYAVTAGIPLSGVAFGVVQPGSIRFAGLTVQDGTLPAVRPGTGDKSLPNQLAAWQAVLEQLATDFRNGHAEVNPADPRKCIYCKLHTLCRINDASTVETLEDAADD
jgi:ATP-dependent helicase/nuclease subunit B